MSHTVHEPNHAGDCIFCGKHVGKLVKPTAMTPQDQTQADDTELRRKVQDVLNYSKSPDRVEELMKLIHDREQAAELRGRIDELDKQLPKTIGYDVIWSNPQIHQNVTKRIVELLRSKDDQATKPEKEG